MYIETIREMVAHALPLMSYNYDNGNDNDNSLFRNTSYIYNKLIRLNIDTLKN